MIRIVLALLLVGCASPKPVTCPSPGSTIPPPDTRLATWKQIAATEQKAPPTGMSAATLTPELVAYLSSPDPERRDHIAYEVLATWIKGKRLTDLECTTLAKTLLANLDGPLDVPAFGRSFSALVLAEIVRRDRKEPFLSMGTRKEILRTAHRYAQRETDLRGYTGDTGWSHAAAHTGDLLAQLAQEPTFREIDRATILDAVAGLVARKHGERLGHGEDSRLAAGVIGVAKLGVSPEALADFIGKLRAPLVEKGTPAFDAGLYYAQRNTRDLLAALFVHGATTKEPTPGEAALYAAVKALIEE